MWRRTKMCQVATAGGVQSCIAQESEERMGLEQLIGGISWRESHTL